MNRKYVFYAIVIAINISVVAACAYFFFKHYSVVVYRKQTSPFMQTLSEMTVKSQQQAGDRQSVHINDFDYRKPHPYTGFKTQPSTLTRSTDGTMRIETNSFGHRSPELGRKKPGVVRIAMVGGSVAFQGQSNESTIIARLAELMSQRGIAVEFINTGVLSFVSEQEVAVLVHDLLDLEIDLLVSFDGFNDIHQMLYYNGRIGWPPVRWDNLGAEGSKHLNQLAPSYYPKVEPKLHETSPTAVVAALDSYLGNVEKMARICKEYHIAYIACLQPWKDYDPKACQSGDTISNEYGSKDFFYCQAAKTFDTWDKERKFGAFYLPMAGFFANSKDSYIDECHFTDEANAVVAQKLLDVVAAQQLFATGQGQPGN